MVKGLDVSHWQSSVDWRGWADKGYAFVWIKATEGTGFVDGKYNEHIANARANGFYTAPYHYFRVQWGGATQAQHLFNNAPDTHMPPAIDVERYNNTGYSKSLFASRLKDCLNKAEELYGRKPIIYSSKYMWESLVGSATWASEYDLWAAHYTTAAHPLLPSDWTNWKVWQYTSIPIDQNRFNGDVKALEQWIGIDPPPSGELEARVEELEKQIANVKRWGESFQA